MKDEFATIATIAHSIGKPSARVIVGIGDDTAVLSPISGQLLFCSDAMVESVHFDLEFSHAKEIGHKALAATLSDLAAMNGEPLHIVISLAVPKTHPKINIETFISEFYQGATALTRTLGADIVGGDLTSSPSSIFIDVACVGRTDVPFLRSGLRVGDLLAVSGSPGTSAAGLKALQLGIASPILRAAHLQPRPRFDLLPQLNKNRLCTAAIDISDGLSSEANHLARASGVSIEIEADKIPIHPEAADLARLLNIDPLVWALSGGEDYELLVGLDPQVLQTNGHPPRGFTVIGRAIENVQSPQTDQTSTPSQVTLVNSDRTRTVLSATGFNHFK